MGEKIIIAATTPRKRNLGSELIKWYQGGTEYSHMVLIKGAIVYQCTIKGVHTCILSDFLKDNKLCFELEVDKSVVDWDYVYSQILLKTRYATLQVFKIVFKFLMNLDLPWDNKDQRLICSEFVGRALRIQWVDDYTDPEDIVTYLKGCKDACFIVRD